MADTLSILLVLFGFYRHLIAIWNLASLLIKLICCSVAYFGYRIYGMWNLTLIIVTVISAIFFIIIVSSWCCCRKIPVCCVL